MKNDYLNIYNNLIKLTRNKNLYINLKNKDTFSDRLIILLFHLGFFFKVYKAQMPKNESQAIFDFIVRQIELSIREIGYGDVSVNKKMKDYVNLFYSVLENIDKWEDMSMENKSKLMTDLMNIKEDNYSIIEYFDKYRNYLLNNPLKNFTKDILEPKF